MSSIESGVEILIYEPIACRSTSLLVSLRSAEHLDSYYPAVLPGR